MMDWTGNVGTFSSGSLASNCNVSLKLWRCHAQKDRSRLDIMQWWCFAAF